jgi:hypothetical protein
MLSLNPAQDVMKRLRHLQSEHTALFWHGDLHGLPFHPRMRIR